MTAEYEISGEYQLITEDDMAVIRVYLELIDQHRLTASALQAQLHKFIEDKYGISLTEESWNLDIKRGILTPNAKPVDHGGAYQH